MQFYANGGKNKNFGITVKVLPRRNKKAHTA